MGLRKRMELKDVIIEGPIKVVGQNGNTVIEECVDYNITKGIAEIEVVGYETEVEEESESRFKDDIKKVVKLAIEAIPMFEDKIKNNKTVMLYSTEDEVEMAKCKKHLANNENRLVVLKEFILKNMTGDE